MEVNNYYNYTKKKSGGGCDAGMAGFVLLGAIPACAAIPRKNRKK